MAEQYNGGAPLTADEIANAQSWIQSHSGDAGAPVGAQAFALGLTPAQISQIPGARGIIAGEVGRPLDPAAKAAADAQAKAAADAAAKAAADAQAKAAADAAAKAAADASGSDKYQQLPGSNVTTIQPAANGYQTTPIMTTVAGVPGNATPGGVAGLATGTGYTANTAASRGYDTTSQAPVVKAGVADNVVNPGTSTVQGQLSGIIAANSPLMQKAKADALAQMNDRGLLNSSIAIGAGQNAVIANAMPIATSDAATYAGAATQNAQAANQAELTNAGMSNTVNATNANFANAGSQFGAQAANTAAITNAAALNNAAQLEAQAKNTASLENTQLGTNTSLANAAALNTAALTNANSINSVSLQNAAAINDALKFSAGAANTAGIVGSQLAGAQSIANINAASQQKISALDNQYKEVLQTDASAAALHSQFMQTISAINANVNLNPEQKQEAIDNQTSILANGLAILKATTSLAPLTAKAV